MKTRASKTPLSRRQSSLEPASSVSVRPDTQSAKRPPQLTFKEILVPFDFSKPSEKSLQYAIEFARQFDGRLTLVYVVEPPGFASFDPTSLIGDNETEVRTARERLTALRLKNDADSVYIKDIKVLVGKPFDEISRVASGLKQDLIIIATHGRTGLKHVMLGSTAEKVIRHAPCPVLVVREKGRK